MLNHTELVELYSKLPLLEFEKTRNKTEFDKYREVLFASTPNSFWFEKDFPLFEVGNFMYLNWSIIFGIAGTYLVVVFGLQEFMKSRKPLNLKWSLFVWNLIIGLVSIGGFVRAVPELWKFVGRPYGFYESICIPNYTDTFVTAGAIFTFSKIPELVDTVFVVLKKKPLEAAQWYHHVVTVIGAWICSPYSEPVTRYMVVINFGVHSLMYPYFALKAIGINVPRGVAKVITTFQFGQMVVCFFVNVLSAFYALSGTRFCHRHPVSLKYLLIVNVTFLWLFGRLFLDLVLKATPSSVVKQQKID